MGKAVLVMDMPESCEKCIFNMTKYSLPLSTHRKGLYCQLDAEKEVFDMDYNDYEFKSEKCPLRELPAEIDVSGCKTEITKARAEEWNKLLHILKGGMADG